MAAPLKICITGAAGQIGYSLVYMIGSGAVFGEQQPVILQLLDIPVMMPVLKGVAMEIDDCALPCVKSVMCTSEASEGFDDVDACFLVGAMPRKEGMERKDLLAANVKIFKVQGEALDKYAKKTVQVLVVGNPANTNALICSQYAPSIPKENFSAMTRLDQNRAGAQIANRLSVPITDVKNCIIWGNHSATQFPDVRHATVQGKPVYDAVADDAWLKGDFITTVQKRGAAVIAARKLSSAMSAAKAACDHMKSIFQGTAPGEYVSMGVFSDGSYGSPEGIMFSFPVTLKDKKWTIVQGLSMDDFTKEKLRVTGEELCGERTEAMAVIGAQ